MTPAQQAAIDAALHQQPSVRTVEYVSREEAYRSFRERYVISPTVPPTVGMGMFHASFQLTLHRKAPEVLADIALLPGVMEISDLC